MTEIKIQIINQISKLLKDGKLPDAEDMIKTAGLSEEELTKVGTGAFFDSKKQKDYETAVNICKIFGLPNKNLTDAIDCQFNYLVEKREYEKASEWGKIHTLPKEVMSAMAVKGYQYFLNSKAIIKAINFKILHEIPEGLILSETRSKFNSTFENKEYQDAMLLGCNFGLNRVRTLTSGLRFYKQTLNQSNIALFLEYENQYNLLLDKDINNVDQKDSDELILVIHRKVIIPLLEEKNYESMQKFAESLNILQNVDNNFLLRRILDDISRQLLINHSELIKKEKSLKAFELVEKFKLLEKEIQPEIRLELIKTVEEQHNIFLDKSDLPQALFLKDNYNLYTSNMPSEGLTKLDKSLYGILCKVMINGDIDAIETIRKEYYIDTKVIKTASAEALKELVKSGSFFNAIELIKHLRLVTTDPDILGEATIAFDNMYENNQIELASKLAFHFNISGQRSKIVAAKHWKLLIDINDYEQALSVYKTRKFLKKMISKEVKELYKSFLKENEIEKASSFRNQYGVKVSIFTLIIEFFKRIFKL